MANQKHQPIDKERQKYITQWLKGQRLVAKKWIFLSGLIGFCMSICLIVQAFLLAKLLHAVIIENQSPNQLISNLIILSTVFIFRALLLLLREQLGQKIGQKIRVHVRNQVFRLLDEQGPSILQKKTAGAWSILMIEQIDNLNDYYAKFLPQMQLVMTAPLIMLAAVFWFNWAAGLILLFTAPLIPIFMAFVGMGAADANRRNFQALSRLSGYFLDRLKGIETLRIFDSKSSEIKRIETTSDDFRQRTMEVLRIAFLSSGVLEFFTSVSIAVMAVYFGFSFLGDLNFGHYGLPITLFIGFFCLILAPEFYQPLRDLGTFYHAKAQAVGAADTLISTLENSTQSRTDDMRDNKSSDKIDEQHLLKCFIDWKIIELANVSVKTHDGKLLVGPINFTIKRGEHTAIVGPSGSGKTSLVQCLMGFLPYEGEIKVDGHIVNYTDFIFLRQLIHWLDQSPVLPGHTIRDNLELSVPEASNEEKLINALTRASAIDFVNALPDGLDTKVGENSFRLSVGQAQRVAVARLFVDERSLWILDEPTASLDSHNAAVVMRSIYQSVGMKSVEQENVKALNTTLILITHELDSVKNFENIFMLEK